MKVLNVNATIRAFFAPGGDIRTFIVELRAIPIDERRSMAALIESAHPEFARYV
jgi:hypothetical protein